MPLIAIAASLASDTVVYVKVGIPSALTIREVILLVDLGSFFSESVSEKPLHMLLPVDRPVSLRLIRLEGLVLCIPGLELISLIFSVVANYRLDSSFPLRVH